MSDDVAVAADKPIEVKASAAQVAAPEALKLIITGGLAYVVAQAVHSEMALIPVLAGATAAGGLVATFIWGVWHRLHTWRTLKFMAGQLPDDVAVVGKAPQG